MTCVVCRQRAKAVGLICDDCRDDIASPVGLLPHQLLATIARPTDDALIDQWGRAHPIGRTTAIGRALDGPGMLILDASVSRKHASLTLTGESWRLQDCGSANGTYLGGELVGSGVDVPHGGRLAVGSVGFYLVCGLGEPPVVTIDAAAITTVRQLAAHVTSPSFDEREDTDVGLPTVELRLVEPTGGGGGLLEIGEVSVKLPPSQLELLSVLARRMTSDEHQPPQVRGFVRSSELIASISWDAKDPDDNHLRQLIRRLRRTLVKANFGDLIESRHSFGYRLRVIPHGPAELPVQSP